MDGIFGRRIFKGDFFAGLMHIFIMWGFIWLFAGTILSTTDYWLVNFLYGKIYLIYSFCLEIAGIMLITGLFMALIRRYIIKIDRLDNRPRDVWVLILLLACVLTGFFVEGVRLASLNPEWGRYSFAGLALSFLFFSKDQAVAFYPFAWWDAFIVKPHPCCLFPFQQTVSFAGGLLLIYI